MAVSASPTSQFVPGIVQPIFDVKLGVGFQPPGNINANATVPYPYIVSEDGERFLVSVDVLNQAVDASLIVTLNWAAALKN